MTDTAKSAANRVEFYDTTLRDGTQAQGVSLSMSDKLEIADVLDDLGVDIIEGGYPLSNPKDAAFFQEAIKKNFRHAKLAAFGMTRRKGVKAADDVGMNALLDSEAPVITIVGKTWDLHVREVLGVSEDENLDMIADSVALMAERGRRAIYDAEHFFDGYRANPEYAMKTLAVAFEAGADTLALCDTNGGSTLADVSTLTTKVVEAFPNVCVGIHCHNDSDIAVANTLMAVRHGARQVQGTINGIGERTGNANLISLAANLSLKYGYDVLQPGAIAKLTKVSRFVYEQANLNLRDNQPYVGSGAFAHKGGMHVHAVQRNAETYEHISPETVGNSRRVLVSELSGVSNIAATVGDKFDIADDKDAQRRILQRIMEMENEGYEFESAEASYEMLIRRTLGTQCDSPLWTLDHYRCVILKRGDEDAVSEATIKLNLGPDNELRHTVAEGNGPVDSLVGALKAALRERYPVVDKLHLIDYRVRVVNTAAETAARVRVVIDWRDASYANTGTDEYFGSVGVDENIIDASWLALIDAIEYKLLNT